MKITFTKMDKDSGFALLLSIIIASVVLAIGVAILKISVSQLQLSATGRESEISFQASQSMSECLTYWRYANREQFVARPGTLGPGTNLNAPPITCMGSGPSEAYAEVIVNDTLTDPMQLHIVKFHYTFPWGEDPEVCSSGDMYIMVPLDGEQVHTFPGTSVGEDGDGEKRCPTGSVCTIMITQGYNRPCDQLQSSIFTLQREITTEF